MICSLALGLALWFGHHHKPKHEEIFTVVADADEINKAIAYMRDIHDNYPQLRPWAEPTLDIINRLQGDDPSATDDLDQLHHDIKALEAMKDNATI